MGRHLAEAAQIYTEMLDDRLCTKFLSFPAALVATGTRGVIVDMIREGMVDVIVTASGTLDHDLARSWGELLPWELRPRRPEGEEGGVPQARQRPRPAGDLRPGHREAPPAVAGGQVPGGGEEHDHRAPVLRARGARRRELDPLLGAEEEGPNLRPGADGRRRGLADLALREQEERLPRRRDRGREAARGHHLRLEEERGACHRRRHKQASLVVVESSSREGWTMLAI